MALWPVDPDTHRMPLVATAEEFDALVLEGHLLALRPDQVRVFRELQLLRRWKLGGRLRRNHHYP
jgi:hypothetical protein